MSLHAPHPVPYSGPELTARMSVLPRLSGSLGVAASAVGMLVLVGWAFDLPVLTQLHPALASMKANTAIGFILCGLALWSLGPPSLTARRRILGQGCAALAGSIGLLTLFEYGTDWNLGIDCVFFENVRPEPGVLYPGRMSIMTAFGFVCLSAALTALPAQWMEKVAAAEALALPVLFVGGLGLIGYLYDERSLYQVEPYSSMALHTAFLFTALSVGVFMARPGRGLMRTVTSESAGGVILRRVLPIAIGTPIVIGWLRLKGGEAGIVGFQFGLALFAALSTIIGTALLWRLAASLNRTDVERTKAEDEVMQLLHETQQRRQELEDKQAQLVQSAKLASIGELATGIAHELNNPLNNISLLVGNAIDALEQGKPGNAVTPGLASALQQVQRAAVIIRHLQTFGRSASAAMVRLSMNEVLKSAVSLMQEQLRLRSVEVALQLSPAQPVVMGNAVQLEQVLINLLGNAGDAMRASPTKRIILTTEAKDSMVDVTVQDTGRGIPPHMLPRIFDPFFTTKPVGEGTGLGLSIAYGIIKEHRGTITVQSEPDEGTTFTVTLPLVEPVKVESAEC